MVHGKAIETTPDRTEMKLHKIRTVKDRWRPQPAMGMPLPRLLPPPVSDCSHEVNGTLTGKEYKSQSSMPEALVANAQLSVVPQYR
jgi:hypothetical protein